MSEHEHDASELLADYVAGRLSTPERARLEAALARDPRLAAELAFHRAIMEAVQSEAEAEAAPGALGWARLQKAMRAVPGLAEAGAPALRAAGGWRLAAIVLGAVACVESALLAADALRPDSPRYLPVAQAPTEDALRLRVAFAPDATEAVLRTLLVEVNAVIVDGPSAVGFYELRFASPEAREAAMARFRAQPGLVESISTP